MDVTLWECVTHCYVQTAKAKPQTLSAYISLFACVSPDQPHSSSPPLALGPDNSGTVEWSRLLACCCLQTNQQSPTPSRSNEHTPAEAQTHDLHHLPLRILSFEQQRRLLVRRFVCCCCCRLVSAGQVRVGTRDFSPSSTSEITHLETEWVRLEPWVECGTKYRVRSCHVK